MISNNNIIKTIENLLKIHKVVEGKDFRNMKSFLLIKKNARLQRKYFILMYRSKLRIKS